MAITNYGELKTAIDDWVGETLTATAADFVTLAQNHISTSLRHRRMIATPTDLSPTSGEFTIPDDYRIFRRVVELSGTTRRPLEYITPEVSDSMYPTRPAGLGCHFTTVGNKIRVFPTITNDIELTYFADLAAFSADGDTDWLLTKNPMLYLRASQMMAADFLKDDTELQKQATLVSTLISNLNAENELGEFGNAGITLSGNTP